jgi:hypothetical protein
VHTLAGLGAGGDGFHARRIGHLGKERRRHLRPTGVMHTRKDDALHYDLDSPCGTTT